MRTRAEFAKLGRVPVLEARVNADLHMAGELANTGQGNLFVIFGEPDVTLLDEPDGRLKVKVNGVDVFHPQTGEVRSDGPDGIALVPGHGLQRGELLRPPRLLPGRERPLRRAHDDTQGGDRSGRVGELALRCFAAFPKPKSGRVAVKVIKSPGG